MRLRFQKRALQQIDEALTYIAEQSPQGAARVEASVTTALSRLRQFPLSGRKTSIPGVRRAYLTPYPYVIDYFVGREEIVVQRFRHTARKPLAEGGPT